MKKKILIVDDVVAIIHLAAHILTNEGYLVEYATNGNDAIEWIKSTNFDLVLLDVMMPDMDGFQVCKIIRENPEYNDLPIIFISANTDEENTIKGLKLGAQDFATKPYNSGELISRIETHIELSSARKKLHALNLTLEEKVKELSISEISYRRLFESAKDGILILDAETGMIKNVNPFLIELLGYSKEQLFEKEIWEIGFFKDILANKDKFLELQQKEYVRYEDLPLETALGIKINVEFVSNVYLVNNTKVIQCNIRDISDRRQMEDEQRILLEKIRESNEIIELNLFEKNSLVEELSEAKEKLEQTNSEKDKFFSIIAHDLKSPFSGFLGLTKIMAEDIQNLTTDEMHEFALDMQSSANNLYKLLENLLEWARMKRGVIEFNPEMNNLKLIIKQILDIQLIVAKQKEIEFVNNIPDDLIVSADISMLNTVLRNLISNAIKFTRRGGKIEVGAKIIKSSDDWQSSDDFTEIYIKDNGIGMSDNMIKELFKIDSRVSRPGTENESSTGLGLILCKEFIEKHSGRIWVESEVGKGSEFHFTLPKAG
jgi:PAS domain S-box-containing protein